MSKFTYYTDGAATMIHKNGKYLREAGGWAFVLLIDGKKSLNQSGGCPLTTNNEMELYAIYASMKDFLSKANAEDVIEICSDSSYCIDIFTKWGINWQKNGWKRKGNKPIENLEIIKAIWKLMSEIKNKSCILNFIKVKGHSSDRFNNMADELAVSAKSEAFKSQKTVGYSGKDDDLLGGKSGHA
ncbi:MAG: ribonuclease HI [Methanobrevibacter sp.]|uniref:ribonuclease H family protein n=1 Tax=Methanobrevibacter sp. TaxID=66852 RepID=UPI0025D9A7C8|nr:ribonuclease H [Methanobrevibacter sp.]MBR0271227.1 ribonuclease HI [Methanobrevibacter sp.]